MSVFDWQFLPSPVLGCLLGSMAWFHNWAFMCLGKKVHGLPQTTWSDTYKGTTWEWKLVTLRARITVCTVVKARWSRARHTRRDCQGQHLPTHFEWSIRLPKGNLPHGQTIWETISQFLHRFYVSLSHEPASHSDHLPRRQENMSTQRLAHTQSIQQNQ